jgi:hypothetical protein
MTVSSATSKVQYNGNGSTTVFAYTFKIFNQNDLTVIVRSAAGTETVKTITTHYTVSGVGSAGGGNVTMLTAPIAGETLTILREQDLTQELDLVENDPFPAQSLENALDKLTFIVQQQGEELTRAIKAPRTNTIITTEFTVPADRASKVLAFDASGNVINGPTINNVTNAEAYATAAAASATAAALYAPAYFNNFAALKANTSSWPVGQLLNTRTEGFVYQVAASSATDHHITTAGGTKLYVQAGATGYNVKAFGAVGDGTTDDTVAIQTAVDYAYVNKKDVVYPADISAYYKVTLNIVCRPGVGHRGLGGYAKIKNLNTGGASTMDRAVFLTGNLALQLTELLTVYDCGTISSGTEVTLTTPGDAAIFSVGDQVATMSTAFRLVLGLKLNEYMHLNRVKAISGAVITLEYPIDVSYAGGLARLASVSSSLGTPINIPLYFIENCVFENLDIEAPAGPFPGYGGLYNVTFTNCIIKGRWTIYGNCFQYCKIDGVQGYFNDIIGEFAQNSLYTSITNSSFSYYEDAVTAAPIARFQIGEASRGCSFSGNTVDVNNLAVVAGNSLVTFNDAQYCEYNNNIFTGDSAASGITICTFAGRSTGLRCSYNTFTGNTVKMNNIRMFVYFSMVDNSNVQNRAEDNQFMANSGDFAYSLRLDNSYDNIVKNNISDFGAIFFNDTASSKNIVSGNYFPSGFSTNETSLNDDYYQKNTLRNNASTASKVKQNLVTYSAASVSAPASTTTAVYSENIGTSLATRDRYEFEFFIEPAGTANTKPIVFNLRNNTDSTDLNIFSHTIPAASVGLLVVKVDVVVKPAASGVYGYTTVYDTTAGTTTSYVTNFVRPTVDKDLSFILNATPGASTSLSFVQITAEYSNPYN